jgi:hypothetical protein
MPSNVLTNAKNAQQMPSAVSARERITDCFHLHDHGAGGHLNCLSELIEETYGKNDLDNNT